MKKLWVVMYLGFIPATMFADFYHEAIPIKKIGGLEVISNLTLIFYYISNRKTKSILNDWFLVEALLFTCAGGVLLQLYENHELLMFINTVGFYLTQFMYINIFREDGSSLPPYFSAFKEWKMILITILFAVGFLIVLIPHVPSKLLIVSFVYSTQMLILFWMVYYRPVGINTYRKGLWGVILLIISNLWLTINLLTHQYQYMIFTYFILYASSQLLIVASVLENANLNLPSDNLS